jgi:hypothetical protein
MDIDTIYQIKNYLYLLYDRLNRDKQHAFVKQEFELNTNTN